MPYLVQVICECTCCIGGERLEGQEDIKKYMLQTASGHTVS